jgi:hypothetical protein
MNSENLSMSYARWHELRSTMERDNNKAVLGS